MHKKCEHKKLYYMDALVIVGKCALDTINYRHFLWICDKCHEKGNDKGYRRRGNMIIDSNAGNFADKWKNL